MLVKASQQQYEKDKKISAGTIKNRNIVVKNLLEILKNPFDWKFVSRRLPKPERYSNDRATYRIYNVQFRYSARCIGIPKIETHCSIKRDGKVVATLMEVYAGTDSQYPTLITKEAYDYLETWIDFRIESREEISGKKELTHGKIGNPMNLSKDGVKGLIDSALRRQG